MMKIILVLLDGLGDRSYKRFGWKTPLQAAATPNMDRLASIGSNGLFHPSLSGQCLPSETAHYLLFGYELKDFPGRGLLEAVGEGIPFDDGDVLALAHLSQVAWEKDVPILINKRPDIPQDELSQLLSVIKAGAFGEFRFQLCETLKHDAILAISGPASAYVSDSDPMAPGQPMARICALSDNPELERAEQTAKALNEYLACSHRALEGHEINRRRRVKGLPVANFLATQRCGKRIIQKPFDKKWGVKGLLIASGAVYGGVAHELGLAFKRVEDSKDPGDDLRQRIRIAIDDSRYDFVHVHTKVPDEAAHTGDPAIKKAAISALDSGLKELVDTVQAREDLLVAVTADHSTPCVSSLIHSGEPVPVVLAGGNTRRDDISSFDEISAAAGCLGFLKGRELMLMILNYADRSSLLGHQLGDQKRPYIPKSYEFFKLTE